MAKEQERKFILKYLPTGGNVSKIQNILQGYLMLDDVNNLRVRINNDKAYMTYKQQVNNTTKKEFEYEIPLADGLELYDMAPHKLEKIRYSTEFNGNHVDMDVYPDGRMVVEIEYENELTELPEYCGEEVTGKPEWSNIQIAIDNKSKMSKELLTSQQWQEKHPEPRVIDPNGWDRTNYQFSWFEELITEEEYFNRSHKSTLMANIKSLITKT